jgi:hypothetical protein
MNLRFEKQFIYSVECRGASRAGANNGTLAATRLLSRRLPANAIILSLVACADQKKETRRKGKGR